VDLAFPWKKENRRSLGFARDDKVEGGDLSWLSMRWMRRAELGICRSDTQGLKNITTLRTNRLPKRTERKIPRDKGSRSGNRPCRIFV
jgi:hypothetical protein